ncbi:MAG: aminopeptidase P family protein [Gemmatimonadetes bacterium]|jgi:Xaa-Pro dipeptidase|nr:aminopeptidase P family protein [Gemmatimonadota bacterium]MBT7860761.1 aminopeptidase P family protein [Gemmatimonadota bacterium]
MNHLAARAQPLMAAAAIDAWLIHDFRGNNPVLARMLPTVGDQAPPMATRRVALVIPSDAPPRLICHAIEAGGFSQLGMDVISYGSRSELESALRQGLGSARRVAVEYSPRGELPTVSWVDAGTLEMLRELGVEPVSSADLLQGVLAAWDQAALSGHRQASDAVAQAKDAAFDHVRTRLAAGQDCDEYQVQQLISGHLDGFETDHPAIVGVNGHAADPHFSPSSVSPAQIRMGDWLLIDLWARLPGDANVYADITWVACAGEPSVQQQQVFDIVRRARDLVIEEMQRAWQANEPVAGWQLDRLARDHIDGAGYGDAFVHRTGHSLSPGPAIHGMGVNLDDLETHDTRQLLPHTGFTIEPGIYLPGDFGVRLEVDVYVDPEHGPQVTTPIQDEIVRLA